MTTGLLAALVATLVLGFEEGLRRFYPSRPNWVRLRSKHGRRAIRAMRLRLEATAASGTPRVLAQVLAGLVIVWIAAASLLDKRWFEVVADVSPYAIVTAAMLRMPGTMREIAARMRRYEASAGEDPDSDYEPGDGGPAALAL